MKNQKVTEEVPTENQTHLIAPVVRSTTTTNDGANDRSLLQINPQFGPIQLDVCFAVARRSLLCWATDPQIRSLPQNIDYVPEFCKTDKNPPVVHQWVNNASAKQMEQAALWLSTNDRDQSQGVVRLVRERFGLSTLEAIEALKLGHKIRFQEVTNV